MPRVPVYEGLQVQEAPLPGVRLSEGSVTAAPLGGALRGVAKDVQAIGAQEKAKADEAVLFELREEFNRWEQDHIHDAQKGAINKRGRDAFELPDTLPGAFDAFAGELEKRASNETQKQGLARMRAARREQLGNWINGHVGRERENYYGQRYEADIESSKERAASNYEKPDIVRAEIMVQRQRAMNRMTDLGASPEVIQQELQKHETDTHSRVIERFLANEQDQAAATYYKAVGERMDPDARTNIEKALAEGTLRGESQRLVRDLMSKHQSLDGALDEVEKIQDPKKQDAVKARLKEAWRDKRAAEDDARNQNFNQANDLLESSGGDLDRVKGVLGTKWFDSVGGINAEQRRALELRSRQIKEGVEPVTAWSRYYDLKSMASSEATREGFLRHNLMLDRGRLSDTEFKELVGIQEALRSGRRSDELDGYLTTKQIVDDNLAAAGIDPTPKPGSTGADQVAQFRRIVDEQVGAYRAAYGKDMPNKEKQQLVDNLLVKGTVPGTGFLGFFQSERRVFQVGDDERGLAIKVTDIPRGERAKIEDALRRALRPVTDEAVVELYNRKLERVVNAAE